MSMPGLFMDPDGEPLRFFLPMSLTCRNSFKEKIENNGGVLVQSELMTNIIKIGDPAKPQSYDSSWLNFRYIDDALREGQLQNPEFYVMPDPLDALQMVHTTSPIPTTQRETPSAGDLPNGVGSRGTRMEFTPEEDDILRRIVHRPGVATSGNKIYQLIAQQYGGHSFHSWRDRYIRHMRPIWGPPTEETAMDVNATDDFILTQSYLRAPHVSSTERASGRKRGDHLRTPATPASSKKQRAAFSTTDDEILLRAIVEKGETASTYKMLGTRHPHHTWESWKNRVKALKKKNKGILPDPDQTVTLDLNDLSNSNLDLEMSLSSQSQAQANVKPDLQQPQQQHTSVDPNIDPNLQQLQLSMIMDDPNQEAFEQQFADQTQYDPEQDLQMQEQLQEEDATGSPFDFQQTTEDMLRQNLQGHVSTNLHVPHQVPTKSKKRDASHLLSEQPLGKSGRRHINIHDPTADENAGPVSDIEDDSQPATGTRKSKRATKKRKTNAAAQAAAARAAAVPRLRQPPMTPSRQLEESLVSNLKSAKQEHHEREKPGLVQAVRDDVAPDLAFHVPEPRTRAARARAASQEPQQPSMTTSTPKDKQWMVDQNGVNLADHFIARDSDLSDDALRAEEQIKKSISRGSTRDEIKNHVHALAQIDEDGFLHTDDLLQPEFDLAMLRSGKGRPLQEVRATPDSSPARPPVSQLGALPTDQHLTFEGGFEPPSPTPASPNRVLSQSQFLQDTQAIRGDIGFDFDATLEDFDSEEERRMSEAQLQLATRKADWIARQVNTHYIPAAAAEAAWNCTSGVQAMADKVIEVYRTGKHMPRVPGVWLPGDDHIIRSADSQAIEMVDNFHKGDVESRLLFLETIGQ